MKDICWLDIAILLPLLVGLVMGIIRGLITELNALLALVLGAVAVRIWGADGAAWLHSTLEWSVNVSTLVAYVVIFLVVAIALHLLGKALCKLIKAIKMGWVNHLLGGLFGTLKWAVIVLIVLFVLSNTDQYFHIIPADLKQQSILYQPAIDYVNQFIRDYAHLS